MKLNWLDELKVNMFSRNESCHLRLTNVSYKSRSAFTNGDTLSTVSI